MNANLNEKTREINQPLAFCNIRPPDTCCFELNMTQSMSVSFLFLPDEVQQTSFWRMEIPGEVVDSNSSMPDNSSVTTR